MRSSTINDVFVFEQNKKKELTGYFTEKFEKKEDQTVEEYKRMIASMVNDVMNIVKKKAPKVTVVKPTVKGITDMAAWCIRNQQPYFVGWKTTPNYNPGP